MKLVIDTSAIIAVLVNEEHKEKLIELTERSQLIAPSSLHWEIGNAFTAMFKRKRISIEEANVAIDSYIQIPIRFVESNLYESIEISFDNELYAYDSYFIQCAKQYNCPLLTLDNRLKEVAIELNVNVLEV